MNRYAFIFLMFCIPAAVSYAQGPVYTNGDLKSASKLYVNQNYTFPTSAVGYGNIKEFKLSASRPANLFKEERNTRWFYIDIPFGGLFSFEIKPHNLADDYDWMLYQSVPELQKLIETEKTIPLRTNNTRNDRQKASTTGLKDGYTNLYSKPGPGKAFSKPLQAARGDKLILVIDNIYKNGSGFNLQIKLHPTFVQPLAVVSGEIRNVSDSIPLEAELSVIDDSTGVVLAKIKTGVTGAFSVNVPTNRPLSFTAYHPDYLFNTENFTAQPADTNKLAIYLDTLAPGKKLVLYNINFLANKDEIQPGAQPELDRILRFLKEHVDWRVQLIGHTHNNVFADSRYLQQLSFNRALTVKRFLLSHSIAEKRLSCAGMGGKSPLYVTNDPVKGLKNSRVEVVLVGK